MIKRIVNRLFQLAHSFLLSRKSNITVDNFKDLRLSNNCRFGGVGKIICQGGVEVLDNAAVMSATKDSVINIGKNVFINRNAIVACRKRVVIGQDTVIGPNVVIYDHDHRFDANGRVKENASSPYKEDDVIIGKNVWLGAGSIILRGTVIGDNTIIAAGAVVKGRIPEGVLVRRENNNIIEKLENKCF